MKMDNAIKALNKGIAKENKHIAWLEQQIQSGVVCIRKEAIPLAKERIAELELAIEYLKRVSFVRRITYSINLQNQIVEETK